MADETQITIRGVVRALDDGEALVEVEQGGCGRCHEEGGCGGQHLTQMFCSGPRSYRALNGIGAAVGDRVTVAAGVGSVRRTANLAYVIPMLGALLGAIAGSSLGGDGGAILGALAGLVAGFAHARWRSRHDAGNSDYRPHIVSRI